MQRGGPLDEEPPSMFFNGVLWTSELNELESWSG